LRDGLNTRSTWLFIARMMAILVNIVWLPRDWTSVAGASHRS
jgi:hypothetical protein